MFEITVEKDFAAAHRLREYDGNCEKLHGHNWRVELALCAECLNDLGLAVDFRKAKKLLQNALAIFDHSYLNDLEIFKEKNPSCELIAKNIYETIQAAIRDDPESNNLIVSYVRVWESSGSSVTYRENLRQYND